MLLPLIQLAVLAAQVATPAPAPLKVLVLDVASTDLTESERTTLTNLVAAHLGDQPKLDVLSGQELRQLMALSAQASEVGVGTDCTDACMAELAGAMGAGVVVSTQAGKLGETMVVTIVVFDAAKAKTVARKSVQAATLGELPALINGALDAIVQPLVSSSAPAAKVEPTKPVSARAEELYAVHKVDVCVDQKSRSVWWFCVAGVPLTENAFVRRYHDLTGADDLARADVNRAGPFLYALPIGGALVMLTGAAVGVGMLYCLIPEDAPCGPEIKAIVASDPSAVFGPTLVAAGGVAGGGVMISVGWPADDAADGAPHDHILTEGEGRAALERHNAALRARLAKDLGS